MVMLEVKEVSHFLGGGVSSAFLQPHYLSLGLLVPHFISLSFYQAPCLRIVQRIYMFEKTTQHNLRTNTFRKVSHFTVVSLVLFWNLVSLELFLTDFIFLKLSGSLLPNVAQSIYIFDKTTQHYSINIFQKILAFAVLLSPFDLLVPNFIF